MRLSPFSPARLGSRDRGQAAQWLALLLLGAVLLAASTAAALAQVLDRYVPGGIPGETSWFADVQPQRSGSGYEPLGVQVGSFIIRPFATESFGYDSNIFGAAHATGSAQSETMAGASAESDWSRDGINASVSVDRLQYLQHPADSRTDWTAILGGHLDVGRDQVTANYTHVTGSSVGNDIGTLTVGRAVTFSLDSARISYSTSFGRITLVPSAEVETYQFSGGPAGTDEAQNNRNSFSGSLTAGYELVPGNSLVLALNDAVSAYPNTMPGQVKGDYDDLSALAGIDDRVSALFRFRALFGYAERSYHESQLHALGAPVAELDLIWTPTQLTTVTSRISRSLQSAISGNGTQSYTNTTGRLQVDHAYMRNVQLQGFAEVDNADIQSTGENQRIINLGGSVTWLLNREVSLVGSYSWRQGSDNINSQLNETDSLALLSVNLHL